MRKGKARLLVVLALALLLPALAACSGNSAAQSSDGATGEKLIAVVLPANAMSENSWSYTATGGGQVSEAEWDEYQAMLQEEAGDGVIVDDVMPGTAVYVFKGEREGDVEMTFTYAVPGDEEGEPEMVETYKIKVYADKTLEVVSSSRQ